MRIVVDINHPADVHCLKNFIWEMERRQNKLLITASKKDVSLKLLDNYNINYTKLGTYGTSLFTKMMNIPLLDYRMYKVIRTFKPDIFLGCGSIRNAHVSYLIKKQCIQFEDTEHSMEQIRLYLPFSSIVCTPSCFMRNLGKKQLKFNGYLALAALHPNYFSPNPAILDEIGLTKSDTFIVLRFVSWQATHDIGQHGLEQKEKLVEELDKYGHIFITSEGLLPKKLEKYRLKLHPEKLHDLLAYSTLYIGEGATTASESALLGTHAIYINTIRTGYLTELENRYDIVKNVDPRILKINNIINLAKNFLDNSDLKKLGLIKREKILKDKIDVTKFMINIVESVAREIQR
jgi:predicted glycosyltransferase